MPDEIPFEFVSEAFRSASPQFGDLRSKLDPIMVEAMAVEVIRRIAAKSPSRPTSGDQVSNEALERLCSALISHDDSAGERFISRMRDEGTSIERIYLSYLADAARRLGEWWDADRVSSADVMLGAVRLYGIMRLLSARTADAVTSVRMRAMFATVPGETHTLGVKAAADLLERRGWSIDLKMGRSHDELLDEIVSSGPPIVGLSAAGAHAIPALAKLIISLRIELPMTKILVGGNILEEAEDAVRAMKPDAIALDMPQAYAALARMWRSLRATSD